MSDASRIAAIKADLAARSTGDVSHTALKALLAREARPTYLEVLAFTRHLYECVPGGNLGGHLHIVLDDGNLKDSHIQACIDWAVEAGDEWQADLGHVIMRLTATQRGKVYGATGFFIPRRRR